jgi:hypothetical protein
MTNSKREILEGPQGQGIDEEITYTLTIPASWGTPGATLTVKAYSVNESTGALTDVTSTVMPVGAGSIASQVITLPEMKALTVDVLYRVEVKFATGTDIKEAFAYVRAEQ